MMIRGKNQTNFGGVGKSGQILIFSVVFKMEPIIFLCLFVSYSVILSSNQPLFSLLLLGKRFYMVPVEKQKAFVKKMKLCKDEVDPKVY